MATLTASVEVPSGSPSSPSPSLTSSPAFPASPSTSSVTALDAVPASPAAAAPTSEYDLHYTHYFAHYSTYYNNNSSAAFAAASASSPGGVYTGSIESAAIAAAASAASYYANYYTQYAKNNNGQPAPPQQQAAFATASGSDSTTATSSATSSTSAGATQSAASATRSVGAVSSNSAAAGTVAPSASTSAAEEAKTVNVAVNGASAVGASTGSTPQPRQSGARGSDVSTTSKTMDPSTGEIVSVSPESSATATLRTPNSGALDALSSAAERVSPRGPKGTAASEPGACGYNPYAAYYAFYYGMAARVGASSPPPPSASASSSSSADWYNTHFPDYCSCSHCTEASSYYADYYAAIQARWASTAASLAASADSPTSSSSTAPVKTESMQTSPALSSLDSSKVKDAQSAGRSSARSAVWPHPVTWEPHSSSASSSCSSSPSSSSAAAPSPAEAYAAWYAKYYAAIAAAGPCSCSQCGATSTSVPPPPAVASATASTANGHGKERARSSSGAPHCLCSACMAAHYAAFFTRGKCDCQACEPTAEAHHAAAPSTAASSSTDPRVSSAAALAFLLSPSTSHLAPHGRALSDREHSLVGGGSVGPFSLLQKMNRKRALRGGLDEPSDESDDGASLMRVSPILSPLLRSSHSPHLSPSLPPFHHHSHSSSHLSTLSGFSPSFPALSPTLNSALTPSPPLSSMGFAAPFPRSPRLHTAHSHIREIPPSSSGASPSTFASTSSSFSFFSPPSSSRSPKVGIYSPLMSSPTATFSLPSPSLSALLSKNPLEPRKSPKLSAIKEEKEQQPAAGRERGYASLNHFLRSPLSVPAGFDGRGDDTDTDVDEEKKAGRNDEEDGDGAGEGDGEGEERGSSGAIGSMLSPTSTSPPTFIILQKAVEAGNAHASSAGRKRRREVADHAEADGGVEEHRHHHSAQLKSSHTASLMLSHTPLMSFSSPGGAAASLPPLLPPRLSALEDTESSSSSSSDDSDADADDASAPSSPVPEPSTSPPPPGASDGGDDSMLLQLGETASSMSALATLSTLGNGSSCHQCKSRRPVNQLMFCCNNKKRGAKDVLLQREREAAASGVRLLSCRKKFCDQCLPELDARVLTDTGFLFLADIEARVATGETVLYACYQPNTTSIVYRPGELIYAAPPTRWVDFTHAGTGRLWDATSDDYGSTVPEGGVDSNRLTLRTTPEHDMYVQLCMRSGERYYERRAGRAPIPPHTQPARELAPGYQCDCVAAGRRCTHGYSHYRMFTAAAAGLQTPADVLSLNNHDPHSPVAALALRSEDELDAFLELFGFWLGDGFMSYDTRAALTRGNAVCFAPRRDRDRVYLRGLLARLHLERGQHFTSSESDLRLVVRIVEPAWFMFFDETFGVKYRHSCRHNRRLALLKQGMHSTQRRLSPTSPLPASATPCVAIPFSTRALSVSAIATPPSTTRSLRSASVSNSVSVSTSGMDWTDEEGEGVADVGPSHPEEDDDEDEDDSVASVKWLPDWSLFRLDAQQLRLIIDGLRQADGSSTAADGGSKAMQGEHAVCTRRLGLRDQLIHACLHAGYSAYFELHSPAGEMRGYKAVPYDHCIYTQEEMEAAVRMDSTRQFRPVRSRHDSWRVCYSERVSELLPAQDVRFDGSACRVRQEEQQQQQQQQAAIATQPAELYDEERDGRVWCVRVQHDDHLIFVQRAHRKADGVVTKVGRAMIAGNCLRKFYNEVPTSAEIIASGSDSRWPCPSCRGVCTCAACRRRKDPNHAAKGKAAKKTNASQPRHTQVDEDEDDEEDGGTEASSRRGAAAARLVPPAVGAAVTSPSSSAEKMAAMELDDGEDEDELEPGSNGASK